MVPSDTECALDRSSLVTKTRRDTDCQPQPTHHGTLTSPPRADFVDRADRIQKLVHPWSFKPLVIWTEIHEVRPVTLQLHDVPERSDQQCRTTFRVHWENIAVSAPGQVSCACCDALQVTVAEYRDTVALMRRRWTTCSARRRIKWQRQGLALEQIQAKAANLRRRLFPRGGFFNEDMARRSDKELMAYVCSYSDMSHSFRVCTEKPTSYRWMSVFDPGMRALCQELLQPFRVEAEKSTFATASPGRQSSHSHAVDAAVDESTDESQTDFVGVHTAAGLVVGFFTSSSEQHDGCRLSTHATKE